MKARLENLSAALDRHRQDHPDPTAVDGADVQTGRAMSLGFRVLTEFVAGIVVGALLGWQFDKWLGTSPALLLIMSMLGAGAGFWNVYRIAAAPTGSQRSGGGRSGH
ncbi:MAG: synthase protein [Hyphomicrobiales bacterium]|nr:synthase protein [Hyphomicrobiales bacterium]